jgi:hypothetical protein
MSCGKFKVTAPFEEETEILLAVPVSEVTPVLVTRTLLELSTAVWIPVPAAIVIVSPELIT